MLLENFEDFQFYTLRALFIRHIHMHLTFLQRHVLYDNMSNYGKKNEVIETG